MFRSIAAQDSREKGIPEPSQRTVDTYGCSTTARWLSPPNCLLSTASLRGLFLNLILTDVDSDSARPRRTAFNQRISRVSYIPRACCCRVVRIYEYWTNGAFAFAYLERSVTLMFTRTSNPRLRSHTRWEDILPKFLCGSAIS